MDRNKKRFSGKDLSEFETVAGPYLPSERDVKAPCVMGRLGQSIECGEEALDLCHWQQCQPEVVTTNSRMVRSSPP